MTISNSLSPNHLIYLHENNKILRTHIKNLLKTHLIFHTLLPTYILHIYTHHTHTYKLYIPSLHRIINNELQLTRTCQNQNLHK